MECATVVSNLTADIATPETICDGTAAQIMQVTPLIYVSTDAVIQAIQPLLEPNGGVSQLGTTNMLIVSGSEYDLQRVNQLLMLIDADPFAIRAFICISSATPTPLRWLKN